MSLIDVAGSIAPEVLKVVAVAVGQCGAGRLLDRPSRCDRRNRRT